MQNKRLCSHGRLPTNLRNVFLILLCPILLMGCLPSVSGPNRMYSVADETAALRSQVNYLQNRYYESAAAPTKSARNEIIAERMAAIDANYYDYEAKLTHERQDLGFLSSLANIGLTTTATLVPVTQTKNLLTGISTGLQGSSEAYSNEVLFQKTVQVLQTQMQASRARVATRIIERMRLDLDQYPLAMALSDLEQYYAAGTLTGAVLGAGKTVGDEAQAAEQAKEVAIVHYKYGGDKNSDLLFKFLFPDGKTIDQGRAKRVLSLVKRSYGLNLSIPHILYRGENQAVRARLVTDLNLK